jgi:hypothetical protein
MKETTTKQIAGTAKRFIAAGRQADATKLIENWIGDDFHSLAYKNRVGRLYTLGIARRGADWVLKEVAFGPDAPQTDVIPITTENGFSPEMVAAFGDSPDAPQKSSAETPEPFFVEDQIRETRDARALAVRKLRLARTESGKRLWNNQALRFLCHLATAPLSPTAANLVFLARDARAAAQSCRESIGSRDTEYYSACGYDDAQGEAAESFRQAAREYVKAARRVQGDRTVDGHIWRKASGGTETGWNWKVFTITPQDGRFRLHLHEADGVTWVGSDEEFAFLARFAVNSIDMLQELRRARRISGDPLPLDDDPEPAETCHITDGLAPIMNCFCPACGGRRQC